MGMDNTYNSSNNTPAVKSAGWYPGHMLKAQRAMHEALSLVDLAVELVDARAPLATRNPRLARIIAGKSQVILANKADLACKPINASWTKWFAQHGRRIDFVQAEHLFRPEELAAAWREQVLKDRAARGVTRPLLRPIRVMIVGIPNIGKSTLINRLRAKNIAKTGPTPGVTRQTQWVQLAGNIELLDTPGILWPQLREPSQELLLTLLGNIPDTAIDPILTAEYLLDRLRELPIREPLKKLGLAEPLPENASDLLEALARRRGMLLPGSQPDIPRAAAALLKEFRSGRLGRFTLELPPTKEAEEAEATADEIPEEAREEEVFMMDTRK